MSAFAAIGAIGPQHLWDGVLGRTVHGDRVTLSLIELEPDTDVPEHSHENEQLGICIEGALTFRVGDERRELGPGDTWTILANTPHSATAGPEGSVLVEVFAPVRDDWHALAQREPSPSRWP